MNGSDREEPRDTQSTSGTEYGDLYSRAQIAWGRDAQLAKAAEEFAELAAEVNRLQNDQTTADRLLEEMADARIMLEQLETDFTDDAVERAYQDKLAQLDDRLPNTGGDER
jgi:NTP pyrophosphatase (non-canonical NTP hydrolase)